LSSTWTRTVPRFDLPGWLVSEIEAHAYDHSFKAWRAVEAQHVVSTLRLVDNDPRKQDLLERIVEESKPPLPSDSDGLHYLLSTPFRYPPRQYGSRFRAITDPGVLYAAIERRTACAEMGYWRWRFVADSAGLRDIPAAPQTLFQLGVRGRGVDLGKMPFSEHASLWSDPENYSATQAMGRAARKANNDLVLYRSVRDPEGGPCVAVFGVPALYPRRPITQETWHLTVRAGGVVWQRERRRFMFEFVRG
jgi:hypothetical protein